MLADNPTQRVQKPLPANRPKSMPKLIQHHATRRCLLARGGTALNSAGILHLHVLRPCVDGGIPPTATATRQQLWANPLATTIPKSLLRCVSLFLHPAEIVTITGRSYRLRNQSEPKPEMPEATDSSKPAPGAGTPRLWRRKNCFQIGKTETKVHLNHRWQLAKRYAFNDYQPFPPPAGSKRPRVAGSKTPHDNQRIWSPWWIGCRIGTAYPPPCVGELSQQVGGCQLLGATAPRTGGPK